MMEEHIRHILKAIGEDPNREGLKKTPRRVAEALSYLTRGYEMDPAKVINEALFTEEYEEMIVQKDIDFFSLCEHHLLPFFGKAHVAYIPHHKIVGISKLARLVDIYARRLQVQERMTNQIATIIMEKLDALGVAVVIDRIKTNLLVLPVREKQLDAPEIRVLDRQLKGHLRLRIDSSKFTGTEGSALLHPTAGMLPASQLLLVGMGNGFENPLDGWRRAGARARKEAASQGVQEIAVFFSPDKDADSAAAALIEGALLAGYQFTKYRSNSKAPAQTKSLTLFRPGLRAAAPLLKSVNQAQIVTAGVFLARDLVNEPPSVATARFLGDQAEEHCRGRGLSAEVWNKKKIEAMKLAGLLAVNRGSHEEPRFIKVHYKPSRRPKKRITLIGKGITFDSGGLSLKPSKSMETMKLDMAGGAAVIATMSCLPKRDLDI